jgi:tetratricopeptide (TPR) repeat protein
MTDPLPITLRKTIALIILLSIHLPNIFCQRENLSITKRQIEYFNSLGKQNYGRSQFVEAMLNFKKALEIAESIGDSSNMAKLYSNIGVINDMFGNYEKALINYQKSLLIYSNTNNQKGKESVINNLGIVYEEMGRPKKALENYFIALEIKQNQGNISSIAGTYNNIAIVYENFLNDSDSAYYYYTKALSYYQKTGNKKGIGLIKSNLGIIQLRKDNLNQAHELIMQSYEILKQTTDSSKIANVLFYLGKVHLARKEYKNALDYYFRAIDIAEKRKMKKLQKKIYLDISATYRKNGDYDNAFIYFNKYDDVSKKLMNLEKLTNIAKLEMVYKFKKAEAQISLLRNQSLTKTHELVWTRRMIVVLIVLLILGAVIAILYWRYMILNKNQQLLLLQSQLFRLQTSPHFIFNSLMSIQNFILANKTETASQYLVDFARLTRSILQNTRKSLIPLDEEIDNLKHYLRLEELRFSDKFEVDFQEHITFPEAIQIPPMLTQPFIENAIIHGLTPSPKKGLLKIVFKEKGDVLRIIIEDNGIGREKAALNKKENNHKSMATEITKQRLKLIAKRFNKQISFKIYDLKDEGGNPTGTKVVFTIKLK